MFLLGLFNTMSIFYLSKLFLSAAVGEKGVKGAGKRRKNLMLNKIIWKIH